jgi:hypothetical protein
MPDSGPLAESGVRPGAGGTRKETQMGHATPGSGPGTRAVTALLVGILTVATVVAPVSAASPKRNGVSDAPLRNRHSIGAVPTLRIDAKDAARAAAGSTDRVHRGWRNHEGYHADES